MPSPSSGGICVSNALSCDTGLCLLEVISRLLFIADAHSGVKMGLWPRKFRADDDDKYITLGKSQKHLLKRLEKVTKMAQEGTDELLLVLMSDLVHGPEKELPEQMDTTNVKAQCDAFIQAILPLSNRADRVYAIDALSRYHVDPGRFADDYIAKELGAFGHQAYVSLDLVVQDVWFRFAHHGPSLGTRPHTRGDSVRRFIRDTHIEALEEGQKTPDVFVFAHWHQYYDETVTVQGPGYSKNLTAYFCPPLSFPDKRTMRNVKRIQKVDVGMLALDVEGGNVTAHKWFDRYDVRKKIKHGN